MSHTSPDNSRTYLVSPAQLVEPEDLTAQEVFEAALKAILRGDGDPKEWARRALDLTAGERFPTEDELLEKFFSDLTVNEAEEALSHKVARTINGLECSACGKKMSVATEDLLDYVVFER